MFSSLKIQLEIKELISKGNLRCTFDIIGKLLMSTSAPRWFCKIQTNGARVIKFSVVFVIGL